MVTDIRPALVPGLGILHIVVSLVSWLPSDVRFPPCNVINYMQQIGSSARWTTTGVVPLFGPTLERHLEYASKFTFQRGHCAVRTSVSLDVLPVNIDYPRVYSKLVVYRIEILCLI